MDFINVLIAGGIILVIAAILGIGLAIANKYFFIEEDDREQKIEEILPGYNCGACGYVGCEAMAKAILDGKVIYVKACKVISEANAEELKKYCKISKESNALLEMAFNKMKLSARAYNRILKLARTIADLEGSADILENHIIEAISYRTLDKKYWE